MPQIQIINRQEDPTARLQSESVARFTETIQRQQAFELAKRQYEIQAKNATTDEEKEQSGRMARFADYAVKYVMPEKDPAVKAMHLKIGLGLLDPTNKQRALTMLAQMGTNVEEILNSLKPLEGSATPEQLAGAQAENQRSQASERAAMLDPAKRQALMAATMKGISSGGAAGSSPEGGNIITGGSLSLPGGEGNIQFSSPAGLRAEKFAKGLPTSEASQLSSADVIDQNINTIFSLMDKGSLKKTNWKGRLGIDLQSPLLVGGDQESIQSEMNSLKSIIPFAKGGKQLTPFEAGKLYVLLNITGKDDSTIRKDLQRFKTEFANMRRLAGVPENAPLDLSGSEIASPGSSENDPLGLKTMLGR